MKKISVLLFVLSSFVLFAQENGFEKNILELRNPNYKYGIFQNDILEPHRLGDKIWVNDSIVYFDYVGDDQWLPTDLYQVLTRNEFGSNTSGIKDELDFDLFDWVPNYKDTTVYYSDNTKKSYLRMKWNEEANEYLDTTWYEVYNEEGNIEKFFLRFGDYYRSKSFYFYDEKGNYISTHRYIWNSDENKWYLGYTYERTYNDEGIPVWGVAKEFDVEVDSLVNVRKYIFNNVDGLLIEETYLLWDKQTKSWNNYKQWLYHYNNLKQKDTVITKKFFSPGEWVNYKKTVYSYNSIGKYNSIYNYNWDSIWVNSEKEIYTYINDEYLEEYSDFNWNSDSLKWDIDSRDIYTYDDNFNKFTKINYKKNYEGVFDKSKLIVYTWSEFEVSGIEENDISKIDIFPNPVKDYFTLSYESIDEIKDVTIYSMQGKLVRSLHKIRDMVINIQDLEKGLYIIEVNTIKGKKYNKIIKY